MVRGAKFHEKVTRKGKPKMMTPQQIEKLCSRMAAHCAGTECCKADIRRKLAAKGCSSGEAQHIIDRLVEESFINEERYARAFVADKFRFANWGRTKIRFQLREKGIDGSAIDEALATIDEDDYAESLRRFLQAKRPSVKAASDYERSQKLARSAIARGFEPNLVFCALSTELEDSFPE